jgi:hypothetical protein
MPENERSSSAEIGVRHQPKSPFGKLRNQRSVSPEIHNYRAASFTQHALVFAFPAHGAFVVGDQRDTRTVNFWGAQWAKVTLSGGDAPNSFKGFADTTVELPGWLTSQGRAVTDDFALPPHDSDFLAREFTILRADARAA